MDLYSTNKLKQFLIKNEFDCKILFYGGFPFFCSEDIINYLNYDPSEININKLLKTPPKNTIDHVLSKDIFTIKELRNMFCITGPKKNDFGFTILDRNGNIVFDILDDNDKILNTFSIKQLNDLYLSPEGLQRLLCNTYQPIPKIILHVCKILKLKISRDYCKYEQSINKHLIMLLRNKNYSLNKNIIGYQVGLYFEDYNLIIEMEPDTSSPYYSKNRIMRRELGIKKYANCNFIKYDKNLNYDEILNLSNQIEKIMKLQDTVCYEFI